MKRLFVLVLAAALMLCLSASACAAGNTGIMPLDSEYFTRYGISLTSLGEGKIEILFSCSSVGIAAQLGVSTYNVERWDGSNWEDVTGLLTGSTAKNTSAHSFTKLFHGVPGEKYRVTCSFICTKDNSTETKPYTSVSVVATASKP